MYLPEVQLKAACIQNTLTVSICVLTIGSETPSPFISCIYCLKWEEQFSKETAVRTMNKSEAKGLLQFSEIYRATNNYIKKQSLIYDRYALN